MLHPNAMDKGCRHASSVKKIALKFRLGLTCASARMGASPRWEVFVMRKMTLAAVSAALLSSGAYGQNAASGTHSCEDLEQLELLGARILSAQTVAAGPVTPPSNTNARATGHPEKVVDFGYRGIHEMTLVAKAAVKAYYGKDAQHSYFWGCSNGGRQALMEAQRFPEDYDGILAGAPANFWTHLLTKALADAQATTLDPASYIPPGKLPAIARAVNAACDAHDGVSDGSGNA